jgi:hypothetical protein
MRPRHVRIYLSIFVLFVLFVLAAPVLVYAQDEVPGDNCAVTSYHIEGQANGSPVKTKVPPHEGLIPDILFSLGEEPVVEGTPVAIIVVDDFTSHIPDLSPTHGEIVWEMFMQQLDTDDDDRVDNGAFTLHEVDIADMNFVSGDVAAAVSNKIDELRETSDYTIDNFVVNMSFAVIGCDPDISETQATVRGFLDSFNGGASSKVSASAFVQGQPGLRGQLNDNQALFDLLANPNGEDESVIANILPSSRGDLMETYGLSGDSNADLIDALSDTLHMDPLRLVAPVHNLTGQEPEGDGDYTVVTVASAGNYGPGDPLFPARWPDYIAASAVNETGVFYEGDSNGDGNVDEDDFWSNNGEVSAFGGPMTMGGDDFVGTSLSAPMVGLMVAQSMNSGGVCDAQPIDHPQQYTNDGVLTC